MRRTTALALMCISLAGCEFTGTASHPETAPPTVKTLMVSPQETPATRPAERLTFVVCHGAWAGGFEWKRISERLEREGHIMYRPSYTGNGERAHLGNPNIDLNVHITDISNVILFENLRNVILVGHSYGGMVATGVADRIPERIRAVVYVDAFLPENGQSLYSSRGPTSQPATTQGTTQPATQPGTQPATQPGRGRGRGRGGQVVINGMVGTPGRGQPPYNVAQSEKTFTQPIELKNIEATKKIPTVYLLTYEGANMAADTFYPFSERARGRGWTVWSMESGHVPSMTHPDELTKLLLRVPAEAKATSQ